ncbi:MAG: hypothetical protein ABSD44_04590 [Terracidiphilus sp.]
MICSKCQSHRMRRMKREGFLRKVLLPLLGFYPWRCSYCQEEHLLRVRGKKKTQTDAAQEREEAHGPSAS